MKERHVHFFMNKRDCMNAFRDAVRFVEQDEKAYLTTLEVISENLVTMYCYDPVYLKGLIFKKVYIYEDVPADIIEGVFRPVIVHQGCDLVRVEQQ